MVDTFMALWNQDRRKRARQMLLIFFLTFSLLCIGTSLLFVVIHRGSQHQRQQSSLGQQTPTVPAFGSTVVPDRTPTTIVRSHPTSGATATQVPPVATPTQHLPTATTQPCIGTPTRVASLSTRDLSQQGALLVGIRSLQPFDGGGPVHTPIFFFIRRIQCSTPSPQPGWEPNCTTSNSVSVFADSDTIALLRQNIGFILVSSMLGTGVFYVILFAIKRRME